MHLPPAFSHQMKALLQADYAAFESALAQQPPLSIRIHPDKKTNSPYHLPAKSGGMLAWPMPLGADDAADRVAWHPQGRYLPERPLFTLDPVHHAGGYYVQEASSMFLHEALRQSVDFSKKLIVLDLCAAPGGKSTLVSDMIGPDSLLVANEVVRQRVSILRENMERWGRPNIAVTCADPEEFAPLQGFFDVIVCDAPCSGEGLFRKDSNAAQEWSPAAVEQCAIRQRNILTSAVEALAPGGVLAYSTCTFNELENECNVEWLQQKFGLSLVQLDVPAHWGIKSTQAGYRFFPHHARGEGFFLAVLKKADDTRPKHAYSGMFKQIKNLPKAQCALPASFLDAQCELRYFLTPNEEILALPAQLEGVYLALDKYLKTKWFGLNVGETKGKDFVPSHPLALSLLAAPDLPSIAVSYEQALAFLKKETFDVPEQSQKGWAMPRYKGLSLGWIKILPNRMNNYLPPDRRIRMNIDV